MTQCPVCKISRWQPNKGGKGKHKKVPWKVLRYFPLKSRLQRLFMSTKIAAGMKWHHEKCVNDGVLRHPAYCEARKKFDQIHESFAMDPLNVRLGLATDGFNPFGNRRKCTFSPYILTFFHFSPYILIFPLLVPDSN